MLQTVLKAVLTVTGISVILLSQDGFESDCPETKFQKSTYYR